MTLASLFGELAAVLAFLSFIPYVRSILKGDTKPERATFGIWSVLSFVTLFSYFASGARDTIWITLVYTVCQTFVFYLSFKYGMGGWNKFDFVCITGAAFGIFFWILTKNPEIALYISIVIEILGFLPTIKKSYLYPETENTIAWSIAGIAAISNLFAITSLRPEIFLYPIYLFLGDGIVALLLLFPKLRIKR